MNVGWRRLSRPKEIVADGWVGKQSVVIHSVCAYRSFLR